MPYIRIRFKYFYVNLVNNLKLRQWSKFFTILTARKHDSQIFLMIFKSNLKDLIEMIIHYFKFFLTCETSLVIKVYKILMIIIFSGKPSPVIFAWIFLQLIQIIYRYICKLFVQLLNRKLFFRCWKLESAKLYLLLTQFAF